MCTGFILQTLTALWFILPLKNPAIISMSASFIVGIVVSLLKKEDEAALKFEQEKLRTYLGVGSE